VAQLAGMMAAYNPRRIEGEQLAALRASLREFGPVQPVIVNAATGRIVGGHQRVRAAQAEGFPALPVVWVDLPEADEKRLNLALNRIGGRWDEGLLGRLLAELRDGGVAMGATGFASAEVEALIERFRGDPDRRRREQAARTLSHRFIVPPFSVLDARQGYWQDRKRAWQDLGLVDEAGRGDNLLNMSPTAMMQRGKGRRQPAGPTNGPTKSQAGIESAQEQGPPTGPRGQAHANAPQGELTADPPRLAARKHGSIPEHLDVKRPDPYQERFGRPGPAPPTSATDLEGEGGGLLTGTSAFDPVLAEILISWFCPEAGLVLDPCAGGPTRGLVAAALGRRYTGVDIRVGQVEADRLVAGPVLGVLRQERTVVHEPVWLVGDGREVGGLGLEADFVLTCPPYYDLERYSGEPADLSNAASYTEFLAGLLAMLRGAANLLKVNRFFAIVVGEIREQGGARFYRRFVPDVIDILLGAGLSYYNEAILVTAVGSLPIRTARAFEASRKLGKTHQNVLVFVKGDPRLATKACGEVQAIRPTAHKEAPAAAALVAPADDGRVAVKVSGRWLRTLWHGCDPDYIRTTCHAACCDSSTGPARVAVLPDEAVRLADKYGYASSGGMLLPAGKLCPFKTADHLCGLHTTGLNWSPKEAPTDKPFGCRVSPFTINKGNTLVIRHRYVSLRCHKDEATMPAYRAFGNSLDILFGADAAARIVTAVEAGAEAIAARMLPAAYEALRVNDQTRHA